MTHTPRIFLMFGALASGILASPARADDTPPAAVVVGRHYEVPPPRADYLRLNTAQPAASARIVVRPVGGSAQVMPVVPVTPFVGGAVQVAPGPSLVLEQPGLSPAAREEALRNGVQPIQPVANEPLRPGAPLSGAIVTGLTAAPEANSPTAGSPPPRVFQTMKQAASAAAASPTLVITAIAPVGPEVVDISWRGRALKFITANPMALPGCAIFLVLLAFLFKRSRANRSSHEADE